MKIRVIIKWILDRWIYVYCNCKVVVDKELLLVCYGLLRAVLRAVTGNKKEILVIHTQM